MAVHIFERIDLAVRGWHQLDNAFAGVGGDARCLVEQFPTLEISLDDVGELGQHPLYADVVHEPHHILDADEGDEGFFRRWLALSWSTD